MRTTVLLLLTLTCWLAVNVDGAAGERGGLRRPGFKQARATRGFKEFKDGSLQVGRGFGKRASDELGIGFEDGEELTGSFPVEWIADKMENNPTFARSILRKFVDLNGDGQLTMEELLRPTY